MTWTRGKRHISSFRRPDLKKRGSIHRIASISNRWQTTIEPAAGTEEFAREFILCQGSIVFLKEVHTKPYPVETSTKEFLA